jgi:predicted phosphodiesterase
MTPFQIISDLHLETGVVYPVESITPHSEVMVMAGDIGSFYNLDPLGDFLDKISSKFKHILYVPGNHEYYYSLDDKPYQTTGHLLHKFKKAVSHIENLHVMDRHLVKINGTIFAGATLWSDPYPHKRLPDFMNLDKSLNEYADMHKRDIKWLNRVADLNVGEASLVVITHHAPSKTLVKKSRFTEMYESFYATSLEHTRIFKKANVWVFGHTHNNVDKMFGNTRVISNQAGKKADNCVVDVNQTVES